MQAIAESADVAWACKRGHTIRDDGMAHGEDAEELAHDVRAFRAAPGSAQQARVVEVERWRPPLLAPLPRPPPQAMVCNSVMRSVRQFVSLRVAQLTPVHMLAVDMADAGSCLSWMRIGHMRRQPC